LRSLSLILLLILITIISIGVGLFDAPSIGHKEWVLWINRKYSKNMKDD